MVILTVGLVAMAELMAITLRMQMLGRNETAAVRLIQSKIDQIVNVSFTTTTVADVGGSLTADVANYNDEPTNPDGDSMGFRRRWQIEQVVDPVSGVVESKIRKLTVRIIPTSKDRRTSAEIELSTIIRSP